MLCISFATVYIYITKNKKQKTKKKGNIIKESDRSERLISDVRFQHIIVSAELCIIYHHFAFVNIIKKP